MKDNLNIVLDMEQEYMVAGKTFHLAEKMTHKALMFIANTMAMVLIDKDPENGVAREKVLMKMPVMAYVMFDALTDLDMSEYENDRDDAVLDFYEDARELIGYSGPMHAYAMEAEDAYMDIGCEIKRQIASANEMGPLLRAFGKYLDGDGTQKDLGLIRKLLTDFMIRERRDAEPRKEEASREDEKVVDMSMYKIRKDK